MFLRSREYPEAFPNMKKRKVFSFFIKKKGYDKHFFYLFYFNNFSVKFFMNFLLGDT